ncbi:alpha/beta hydrolase [Pontibacter diazotrophicus]|uniref:Alpha/beta hydrolase n=1 Tax=Pontibacter diazotrophicus TaxID=1400979 RepID=A0A3D8LE24_9BACT|nr:alpha/beta hydrolase [Pontibacter diazotrophicus]RDV15546.1 alpha/beta hydrolase [Pontibacter diazotrophicus]
MSNIPLPVQLLIGITKLGAERTSLPLDERRRSSNRFMKFMDSFAGLKSPAVPEPENSSFTSKAGHEIALRIFRPAGINRPLPVWVYFHGGGFTIGSYDVRDNFCKRIADQTSCVVVSVQYRLAPEHPFPEGLQDCYEATCWVSENAHTFGGDGSKLAVGGESAGGNFAAVVSLMARDKNGPQILHQTLLYPAVDCSGSAPSRREEDTDYLLTQNMLKQFGEAYLPAGVNRKEPYCSPVFADLTGLPPAVVITAEHDPLRDEGNRYAEKLKKAGVPVVHKEYPDMIHDFVLMMPRFLKESREAIDTVNKALCLAFKEQPIARTKQNKSVQV